MKDIIYREDAINLIEEIETKRLKREIELAYAPTLKGLMLLPSAERTGKWEWCGDHHLCSECNGWALFEWNDNEYDYVESLSDFCPDCGARMVTE